MSSTPGSCFSNLTGVFSSSFQDFTGEEAEGSTRTFTTHPSDIWESFMCKVYTCYVRFTRVMLGLHVVCEVYTWYVRFTRVVWYLHVMPEK